MTRPIVYAAIAALLFAAPAGAQARRTATLPVRPSAPPPQPSQRAAVTLVVLSDGSVAADFGRGYERVIRSCASYVRQYRASSASRPPQMGTTSPVPGANGLPKAPDLSPLPGSTRASSRRQESSGYSSLRPLHSGWRTVQPAYLAGACWIQDQYGRLHLIYL